MQLGVYVKQPTGYKAFIPNVAISTLKWEFPAVLLKKTATAERLVGKLDGITQTLPDVDYFLKMYILKDASYSSQIEGTRATMMDALELSAGVNQRETDADDILHYIDALNYGIERLDTLPFSLRYIRELHEQLMRGARSSHFSDPGEFRKSQNWIGGTNINNAEYIPPPVTEMTTALNDLEKFIYLETLMPVLQAGILHAQFETIHPFLDGNGRTGRLMITLFLYQRSILEKPVLFLSSYFKKYKTRYYNVLNAYHNNDPFPWLEFYLDGIIEIATESISTSKNITKIREQDLLKIQALGKREAGSGVVFLQKLFSSPIVTVASTASIMGFTRNGAQKIIDRFVQLGILELKDENIRYGKSYIYKKYIDLFNPNH